MDTKPVPDSTQEAEALLARRKRPLVAPPSYDKDESRVWSDGYRCAAKESDAVIWALIERVRYLTDANTAQANLTHTHYVYWQAAQVRIASLEAERELIYEHEYVHRFTPSEIAARVKKNG